MEKLLGELRRLSLEKIPLLCVTGSDHGYGSGLVAVQTVDNARYSRNLSCHVTCAQTSKMGGDQLLFSCYTVANRPLFACGSIAHQLHGKQLNTRRTACGWQVTCVIEGHDKVTSWYPSLLTREGRRNLSLHMQFVTLISDPFTLSAADPSGKSYLPGIVAACPNQLNLTSELYSAKNMRKKTASNCPRD
ncbi:hypothetical protein Y032_0012g1747 [Ancylostoma ceylanicum]|uniref:Uncharacterized protein n=1 Tax=Ancylostoma ceylanicum TaxID=53326 RepID=A0A016VBZ3_9BILA|nr:hypothetical protein Y032_0012g1747 [Ancylostoma ceylanicum]